MNKDIAGNHFEQAYLSLRDHEQRVYTDKEVSLLPNIPKNHLYKKEWEVRKASCKRLIHYLQKKNRPLKILEVGCGNGWFSNQLATIKKSTVKGIDINRTELDQALRVFAKIENLSFIHSAIDSASMKNEQFDIIVFAASVQYFQSLGMVINAAFDLLDKEGEIHILDTRFYPITEVQDARQRSNEYFQKMGFENMSRFYFHHSFEELKKYPYEILYNADSFVNKLVHKNNPFNWICIKAKK